MASIYPFRAVVPGFAQAPAVAAPPYDVVSREEAAVIAAANPSSFLRVSRAEIELPEVTDPYAPEVYARAAENYRKLCRELPLHKRTAPGLYVYSLLMGKHRQTGLVTTVSVDEYDRDIIKKHERTRPDKEDDRTNHILNLKSQTGPVFLTYKDRDRVDVLIAATMSEDEPLFDFTADDGIQHTAWELPADKVSAMIAEFAAIPYLYIADGHHRAASAARVREHCRAKNPRHTGNEEYNRFLAVLFPAAQLQILAYNRVVKSLSGQTAESLAQLIKADFNISAATTPAPPAPGIIHFYLNRQWRALEYKGDKQALSAIERLDVSLLQRLILEPHLGISDPRTSKNIDFVGGIRGTGELERLVDSGQAAAAFALYPTTVEELMAIADADSIMPPKSTWFEPKLRDGLFAHDI